MDNLIPLLSHTLLPTSIEKYSTYNPPTFHVTSSLRTCWEPLLYAVKLQPAHLFISPLQLSSISLEIFDSRTHRCGKYEENLRPTLMKLYIWSFGNEDNNFSDISKVGYYGSSRKVPASLNRFMSGGNAPARGDIRKGIFLRNFPHFARL